MAYREFKAGDRVVGTDEGGSLLGTVQGPSSFVSTEVLVKWDCETYGPTDMGHSAPVELLRHAQPEEDRAHEMAKLQGYPAKALGDGNSTEALHWSQKTVWNRHTWGDR